MASGFFVPGHSLFETKTENPKKKAGELHGLVPLFSVSLRYNKIASYVKHLLELVKSPSDADRCANRCLSPRWQPCDRLAHQYTEAILLAVAAFFTNTQCLCPLIWLRDQLVHFAPYV